MRKRKLNVVSFALIALTAFFALMDAPQSVRAGNDVTDEYPIYTSYLDVPGITEDEIAALENLKSKRESFTYAMNLSAEAFYDDEGAICGFSALLCDWLTSLLGIEFVPVICEWDELIAGLKSQDIDFTGELAPDTAALEKYIMTGPIAERSIVITRMADGGGEREITEESPARFGFLEGGAIYGLAAPYIEYGFEAYFAGSYEDAYRMLRNGGIDAFFGDAAIGFATDAAYGGEAGVRYRNVYGGESGGAYRSAYGSGSGGAGQNSYSSESGGMGQGSEPGEAGRSASGSESGEAGRSTSSNEYSGTEQGASGSESVGTERDAYGGNVAGLTTDIYGKNIVAGFVAGENSGSVSGAYDSMVTEFGAWEDTVMTAFSPLIYEQVSLAAQNTELAPIISIIQKALAGGGMRHAAELYNEGCGQYKRYLFAGELTDAERQYIQNHKYKNTAIPFIVRHESYPLGFYDDNERGWRGTAFDALADIETLTGLKFRLLNEELSGGHDLTGMVDGGDASFMSGTEDQEKLDERYLWAARPYQTSNYALLSLSSYPDVNIGGVLSANVGVLKDSACADVFASQFPDHRAVMQYNQYDDAFAALKSGEIDLLMATENQLLNTANFMGRPGFKANVRLDAAYSAFFGFNKNEEILCSIMSKALARVDVGRISDRWSRRVFDYSRKTEEASLLWMSAAALMLAILLVAAVVLFVKRRKAGKRLEEAVNVRSRELEAQVKAAAHSLQWAKTESQVKSDFISRMSREIKTHLSLVTEESESRRLNNILDNVIDMSNIESGRFALANEAFLLYDAVKEVEDIIIAYCEEKKLLFTSDFGGIVEQRVQGDKPRLKQVLMNLLENAVKFTPEGGRIDFALNVDKESEDYMTVTFSVADSGMGVTEEQMPRLFNAFERAESDMDKDLSGAGLGLAISQNLVRRMGGVIAVKSTPGAGTVFDFTLPMTKIKPGGVPVSEPKIKIPILEGKHILIVEDIEINRVIMIELLKDTRVGIDEAESGSRAIARFADSPEDYYDLILMDTQMPGMDGYETARRIRRLWRDDAKVVPIIAMTTAHSGKEDINLVTESGMDGYIAKPIDIVSVMRVLSEEFKSEDGTLTV
ncbi:MAG: response regulator [Clostridiales Family XIII bacterium]|jgi:signal transduction histidine kinase/CheY-like chemotaxis protein|nr:response regulator [Clostridiales Family XIII bacterium]